MSNKAPVNCPLLARTIELMNNCGKSTAQVAKEVDLPFYWIQSLRYNHGIDPSVSRVVKLYEHLSGKKLEIN